MKIDYQMEEKSEAALIRREPFLNKISINHQEIYLFHVFPPYCYEQWPQADRKSSLYHDHQELSQDQRGI